MLAAQPSDVRRLGLTPEIPVVLLARRAIASQKTSEICLGKVLWARIQSKPIAGQ